MATKQEKRPLAMLVLTRALQLRILACDAKTGEPIDVGLSLSHTEAQKIADALHAYATPGEQWRRPANERKATFLARYCPDGIKERTVVHLNDFDKKGRGRP